MVTITIPAKKTLLENGGIFSTPALRKWDVVKNFPSEEGIVIRIKFSKTNHCHDYTLHWYKRHKNKFIHKLWFKWLKLRVWIGDFYK